MKIRERPSQSTFMVINGEAFMRCHECGLEFQEGDVLAQKVAEKTVPPTLTGAGAGGELHVQLVHAGICGNALKEIERLRDAS